MAQFTEWTRNVLFSRISKPNMIPHQSLGTGGISLGVNLTIALYLILRLKMSEAVPPFPSYIVSSWRG